jgi:nucleotide-binding universal stress UspA family protein
LTDGQLSPIVFSSVKRILVPVDFSSATECVLALACQMARAFDAELHLLHVREIAPVPVFPVATIGSAGIGMPELGMPPGLGAEPADFIRSDTSKEKERARLDRLREQLSRDGTKVFAQEREGTVVAEILKTAREVSADLIVMGTHGHGAVYNLLVGSVTEGILKSNERPVLLIPARIKKS